MYFKYETEVMRCIAQRNKIPYNIGRIKRDPIPCTCKCLETPLKTFQYVWKVAVHVFAIQFPTMSYASSKAWNTTLSSYWFTWAAQRFMSEHLSPPLRHHSQSGDIWHALAISMDLNPTGFQLTWRNPILYGAPHCITLHTRSHQIPLHWELSQDTWETSIAFPVW